MEAFEKSLFFVKKYGLFICIPVFLLIAYSFVNSSSPRYKATAKIALRSVSPESAADDIKSKYLIGKALDQLHFQVSYYDSLEPARELSADTLPVRLVFNPGDKVKSEATLSITVTGPNSFDLTHVDTVITHQFNEPIDDYYGRFSVVHSARPAYRHVSYIIKLQDEAALVNEFYSLLNVKPSGDRILSLAIKTGSPEKSIAFLDKLIELYGADNRNQLKEQAANSPQSKEKQIGLLTDKANGIKSRIKQLSAINPVPEIKHVFKTADNKQQRIYQVIKPYVEAPVRQFVQVPYTDEVSDIRLRNLLDQYNVLELRKQHILADKSNDSAVILQADNDLVIKRNAIIAVINPARQNPTIKPDPEKINDSLKMLRSSLTQIRANIQSLKVSTGTNPEAFLPGKSRIVILENPKDNIQTQTVNAFWIYMLALIAGLLIPIVWWVVREPRGNILPSNLFNPQILVERINDLFAVKQID